YGRDLAGSYDACCLQRHHADDNSEAFSGIPAPDPLCVVSKSNCFPNLHCFIPGARGDTLAIGRPGYRSHAIRMPGIGVGICTIRCIPELYSPIIACRGDTLAIGRPGYGTDEIGMPIIDIKVTPIDSIPDLYR